jgi:hypothetical protein
VVATVAVPFDGCSTLYIPEEKSAGILVMKRGGRCDVGAKALRAQQAGALAVLIV